MFPITPKPIQDRIVGLGSEGKNTQKIKEIIQREFNRGIGFGTISKYLRIQRNGEQNYKNLDLTWAQCEQLRKKHAVLKNLDGVRYRITVGKSLKKGDVRQLRARLSKIERLLEEKGIVVD